MPSPDILALDFDGVVCDGLLEYFQTAWQAYCQLFQPNQPDPPEPLANAFYRLRPVVETGWEMPILLHALQTGLSEAEIALDWPALAQTLTAEAGLERQQVATAVDGVRDAWIERDLNGWLSLHRFYPGVIERLRQVLASGPHLMIISTKEGRFIGQLLEQQGIQLKPGQILGKEIKQPKYGTLRQLRAQPPAGLAAPVSIWFVEDRLKALELVEEQPDLATVELFLADWGYNTPAERDVAEQSGRIRRLSLTQWSGPLAGWLE